MRDAEDGGFNTGMFAATVVTTVVRHSHTAWVVFQVETKPTPEAAEDASGSPWTVQLRENRAVADVAYPVSET